MSAPHQSCGCPGSPPLPPLPSLIPPPVQGTILTSPDSAIVSAELPPEIIVQNNGQPILVVANNANNAISPAEAALLHGLGKPLAAAGALVAEAAIAGPIAPVAAAVAPLAAAALPAIAAINAEAAKVSDAALIKSALEDAAVPDQEEIESNHGAPCRTETTEESINEGAQTVIHRPAHIVVNQPPTRLIINHPPLIVKPSAIVLHTGGKTIKKLITKEFLPRPVHVRPVIVRIVKPIEKKVLISKPAVPGLPQTIVHEAPIPPPCAYSHSALGSAVATAETLIKDSLPLPAAATAALAPARALVAAESAALTAAAASDLLKEIEVSNLKANAAAAPLLGFDAINGEYELQGGEALAEQWNGYNGVGGLVEALPSPPSPCLCTK